MEDLEILFWMRLKKTNLLDLIKYEEEYLDFLDIFKHFMKEYIKINFLEWMQFDLKNSFPESKNDIKLIHIDSPKFFDEFVIICERFFPLLNKKIYYNFPRLFFPLVSNIDCFSSVFNRKENSKYCS